MSRMSDFNNSIEVALPNITEVAPLNGSISANGSLPPEFIRYHPFFTHFDDTVRVMVALTMMIFGCVANIVSLLGLSHSRINQIPRGLLIIFISVADNLYLTAALVVEMADTFTLTLKPGCPYLYTLLHAIKLWSYSLVVLFLIDRVLSVKCVTWYRKLSSNYWTRFGVCVSLALSCCTSAFLLVFVHYSLTSSGYQGCLVLYPYYEWFSWYLGIALLGFGEVVLELAALVCTGWIIYSLVLGPEKPKAKVPPEKPDPDKKNAIEASEANTADIKRDSISKSYLDLESVEKPAEDIEMTEINSEETADGSTEEEEQKEEEANVCACKYAPDYCVEASVVGATMVIFCVPHTISFMYFHVRLPSQPLEDSSFPPALIVTQTLSLAFHGVKLVLYLCSSRAFRRSLYHICCSCWLR